MEIVVRHNDQVAEAKAQGLPIVALESTVYSTLGLPSPDNRNALDRSVAAISECGAVPAVTAILDGEFWCGIEESAVDRVLEADAKTAERDLAVAVGQGWPMGVTTVSASLAIAAASGIKVFATGGIGGVHREFSRTADESADLGAIARHPLATVSAGAKSFLDLPATLERLETLGAPVIGWNTEQFPAFTARTSGLPLRHNLSDLATLAAVVEAQLAFGRGLLIANPVPNADALDQQLHDAALTEALDQADQRGLAGPDVTPFVLGAMAEASSGQSVPANLALLENNCRLAAELACVLSK